MVRRNAVGNGASSADATSLTRTHEENSKTALLDVQAPVTGRWVGALDTDGNHIEIAITFAERKGQLAGSIDVVGIKAIPLEAVVFDRPHLNLQFDSPVGLAKFTGAKVNNAFTGTIEFPEAEGTFSVARLVPADMEGLLILINGETELQDLAPQLYRAMPTPGWE